MLQLPCPLWQGLAHLNAAVDEALQYLGSGAAHHAITMTGELVDLFRDRTEGVRRLVSAMHEKLAPSPVRVYAGRLGFVTPEQAPQHDRQVASSNWLASATLVAGHLTQGLFLDVGSTTTDVVPLREGTVQARGEDDHQRLRFEELIYTGVVRTSLMAVATRIPFGGEWVAVMAEHFATMSDVYRLTGELAEHADQLPSADQGAKTAADSARRIARMLGLDAESGSAAEWLQVARCFRERQLQRVHAACERSLSRRAPDAGALLIGAGVGRFLVRVLAQRLGHGYLDFAELLDLRQLEEGDPSDCAPAVAVACLARAAA